MLKILRHKIMSKFDDRFNILVVLAGISAVILMLYQFFMRQGFWADEVLLASNFTSLSFADLCKPILFKQVAPLGLLFWEKLVWLLAENSAYIEYWWRLYPFLCGLGIVLMYYPLVYRLTGSKVIALFSYLFLIYIPIFIYYTSEVKQYIGELFCAIVLLYFWSKAGEKWCLKRVLTLIAVIAFGIFNSLTMCFILLPLGLWDGFELLKKSRYQLKPLLHDKAVGLYVLQYGAALLLLVLYYVAFLYNSPHTSFMKEYWGFAFVNTANFVEIFRGISDCFYHPLSIYVFIAAILSLLCLKNKFPFFLAIIVMVTHTLFSALQLYPLHGRLILYWLTFVPIAMSCLWYYPYDFICRFSEAHGYRIKYQSIALLLGIASIIGVQIIQPLKLPIYINGIYMKAVWKVVKPYYHPDDMFITEHGGSEWRYVQVHYLDGINTENIIDVLWGDWPGSWNVFISYVFRDYIRKSPKQRFWLVMKRGGQAEIEEQIQLTIKTRVPDIALKYCTVPIGDNTVCLLEKIILNRLHDEMITVK